MWNSPAHFPTKTISRRDVSRLLLATHSTVFGAAANSAVTIGIIGTGGRGRYLGTLFAGDPRARIVALCDIFADQIDRAKTEIPGVEKSSVYQDYRDLLARPGVDAVVIATPVFLHPEHFEAAVGARKHIYCEKPAAADVAGVKRLLRAAQTADPRQHVVFGFQNRFSPEYRAAEKIVNEGQLGQILFMESHFIRSGVPLNPVPSRIPAEQHLRRWNVWRRTSGDIIVEQDCHSLDVLNWFVKGHPLRAVGSGGRVKRASGDNLDHLAVVFEYPGGLRGALVATQLAPGRYRDVREQFFGTSGVLETHRTYYRLDRGEGRVVKVDSKREITIDAVQEFLERILAKRPANTAASGCESTLTALLGRLAMDARREVAWEEMLSERTEPGGSTCD